MRLKNGRAIGIDLWAPHGGGGHIDLLWRNARLEKVADRIEFKEADARQMPFESETFDVVVSSGAMHHISRTPADFEQAMHEMVRVLKPGGQIVIWDVAHMVNACASRMRAADMKCEVKELGRYLSFDMGIVFGKKADSGL
jgi:ubiquinone/menaquinone biosynthesis C-methylase UbiE